MQLDNKNKNLVRCLHFSRTRNPWAEGQQHVVSTHKSGLVGLDLHFTHNIPRFVLECMKIPETIKKCILRLQQLLVTSLASPI